MRCAGERYLRPNHLSGAFARRCTPAAAASAGPDTATTTTTSSCRAKPLIPPPHAQGKITRPILGVTLFPDTVLRQLGLRGVLVLSAPPDSPAGKAGLRSTVRNAAGETVFGDVIVEVDGEKIRDTSDLYGAIDSKQARADASSGLSCLCLWPSFLSQRICSGGGVSLSTVCSLRQVCGEHGEPPRCNVSVAGGRHCERHSAEGAESRAIHRRGDARGAGQVLLVRRWTGRR